VITLQSIDRHQSLTVNLPTAGVSLQGTLQIPGDKSISHRALMLGALAEGETTIQGLLLGEDPRSTAACFTAMGAQISELNTELVTVTGIGNLWTFSMPEIRGRRCG
jgi:3-phosphoshikimate 1-carboxyvinyltransferase